MKKKLSALLSLLCVFVMLFPTVVSALPESAYAGRSEPLANDAFSGNLPTSNGTDFTGYTGDYTMGSFPVDAPDKLVTYYALSSEYNILCRNQNSSGDGDQWTYGGAYMQSNLHLDGVPRLIMANSYATSIVYRAPKNGTVNLTLDAFRIYNNGDVGGGSAALGVAYSVYKNGEKIFPTGDSYKEFTTNGTISKYASYAVPGSDLATCAIQNLAVQAGDTITFAAHKSTALTDYAANMCYMAPRVTYTKYNGETYAMADYFSGVQGSGGFYAGYSTTGRDAVYTLPQYQKENNCFAGASYAGTVSKNALTVKPGMDTVILFRSPLIATYRLSSDIFAAGGNVTFHADIYRADGTKTRLTSQNYTSASTAFTPVSDIYLDRGDVLAMRFSSAGSTAVSFSPVMASTSTVHATSENGEALIAMTGGYALMPDIHLDTVHASLTDAISLGFDIYLSNDLAARAESFGLLIFPTEKDNYDYNAAYAYTNYDAQNGNTYTFTKAGIVAKQMADTFYVRPYCKTAGGYIYGPVEEASIRLYAESLRDNFYGSTTPQGEALYALACAMLNYGAEAQKQFAHKTDDLANKNLAEAEKAVITPTYEKVQSLTGTATLQGVTFATASLLLEDLPSLLIYLKADAGVSMQGIKVQASTRADFSSYSTLPLTYSYASEAYFVQVSSLYVNRMRTKLYFRITDGTNVSKTLTYSAEAYGYQCHASNLRSKTVTDALFNYVDAALAYAAVSNQTGDGIEITAAALAEAIMAGNVQENGVYRVTDNAPIMLLQSTPGMAYDAKNIRVYTTKPLLLDNMEEVTLSNLHIISTNRLITAIETANVQESVLSNVTVSGHAAVGISILGNTGDLLLNGTDITGEIKTGITLTGGATNVLMTDATVEVTDLAVRDESSFGIYLQNNTITSQKDGIYIATTGSEIRDNTVTASGKAITVSGAQDILVARNTVNGEMRAENGDNIVFLKNHATNLTATGNKHLYAVSNTLTGRLSLSGNNYLLADLNSESAVTDENNQNKNGDDVTAVDARLTVGADEDLLPHVDRDQFTYRERKDDVRLPDGTSTSFDRYLQDILANEDEVIVAPGVYTIGGTMRFTDLQNKTVYAFGVMAEQQSRLNAPMRISGANNLAFHGLTLGFAMQSCGQVYVLEKLGNNTLRVVTGAGMMNEFGNTDPRFYNTTGMGAQRQGTFYAYADLNFRTIEKDDTTSVPTMKIVTENYNTIKAGDILTCRATADGGTSITVVGSKGVSFRDFTIYGNASGFAFVENDNQTATTYYRVADTTKGGAVITEEEYNQYRALESQYGVSLEVYRDEQNNYRGSLPHIGSIDATHTTRCAEGSQATSCLFENMCDDGTNQNHTHGRIDEVIDNGNGTTTIIYKGNLSRFSYSTSGNVPSAKPNGFCYNFAVGDRVYIYTAKGQLICDTAALSATETVDTVSFDWIDHGYSQSMAATVDRRSVTVATSAVNFEALEAYDLKDNCWVDDPATSQKVLIDNMSMASNGFLFDNTMVRNIRSRGLLIKASESTVKHCSLINIGMGAVAIHYEIYWGESGVSENLHVSNNLFQNTGYFNANNVIYSPVSILGLGTQADEDYLLYKNIVIENNKMVDRATRHAIYVNSAKDVTIKNNDFGIRAGYTIDNDTNKAVYVYCAKNVEISGNTYPTSLADNTQRFDISLANNIYGSDVMGSISMAVSTSLAENMPTFEKTDNAPVTYHGNWEYGALDRSTLYSGGKSTFDPYDKYVNTWLVQDGIDFGSHWGQGGGGIFVSQNYRHASTGYYNCAVRYTAEQTGSVDISLTSLLAPASSFDSNAGHDGYIAIFKNNTMLWPTAGGSYTNTSQWERITSSTDTQGVMEDIQNSLYGIQVEKGDELLFVSRQGDGWSSIAMSPAIQWHTVTVGVSSTFWSGSENWPAYTSEESFDGFRGGFWTVGYMPAAGGTYTKYSKLYKSGSILTHDGSAWSRGGLYLESSKMALVLDYSTVFAFHAPVNGTVDLSVTYLTASHDSSSSEMGAKFAIFKNGERIWPTTSNAGDANGYFVYSETGSFSGSYQLSLLKAAQNYEPFPTDVTVTAGDTIQFAMTRQSTYMAYCTPSVTYTAITE